jgi:hypothetical protein
MLDKAYFLYSGFGAPDADTAKDEADEVKEEVVRAYRQDVVALRRALSQRDALQSLKQRAARVRAYLLDCSLKERAWLDNLIEGIDREEE